MNKHGIHIRNFKDGNTASNLNNYKYDANDFRVKDFEKVFCEETERSSMTKDRNKGIESISYNHLNLPVQISMGGNQQIQYQYNAAGEKVRKTVFFPNGTVKPVDYLDGFQYAGDILQFFPHPEGYVDAVPLTMGNNNNNVMGYRLKYVYNYTDHLGNIRLSYTKDPKNGTLEIMDENHYFPFGLKHTVYVEKNKRGFELKTEEGAEFIRTRLVQKTDYQYKYNGKEWQDELGLSWYDYGARNYDPAIGRWMNIDPMAPKYFSHSTYAYALNAPSYFIDPDGMQVTNGDPEDEEMEVIDLEMVVITGEKDSKKKVASAGFSFGLPSFNATRFVFGRDGVSYIKNAYDNMNSDVNRPGFMKMIDAKSQGEMIALGIAASPFMVLASAEVVAYGSMALAPEVEMLAVYGAEAFSATMETPLGQAIVKTFIDASAQEMITGKVNVQNAMVAGMSPNAIAPLMGEVSDASQKYLKNSDSFNIQNSLLKIGGGYLGNLGEYGARSATSNGYLPVSSFLISNGIQSFSTQGFTNFLEESK